MRYSRHISLSEVGEAGQQRLLNAKVLIIGAGGLGCPALQYLSAAGVGTIGIVDSDTIDVSNLQRQVLFTTQDIGLKKVEVAKKRLNALNPDVEVNIYPKDLRRENALDVIGGYDIVIDGTDNFTTRYLVNDACVKLYKPFVYGAIHKFEGQLSVFNLDGGPTYRCLFPDTPAQSQIPNCSEVGVLGVLPGVVGTLQAAETIKIIIGIGEPLSGKLKLVNMLNNQENLVEFTRNDDQVAKALATWEDSKYEEMCSVSPVSLSWEHIFNLDGAAFLDVRESYETPKLDKPDVLNIPMNEILERWEELRTKQPLVVFCQHGVRSQHVIAFLHEKLKGQRLINAEGGIVTASATTDK